MDIQKEIKFCRQCALSGEYSRGIRHFEALSKNLHQLVSTLSDPVLKKRWTDSLSELEVEANLMRGLSAQLEELNHPPGQRPPTCGRLDSPALEQQTPMEPPPQQPAPAPAPAPRKKKPPVPKFAKPPVPAAAPAPPGAAAPPLPPWARQQARGKKVVAGKPAAGGAAGAAVGKPAVIGRRPAGRESPSARRASAPITPLEPDLDAAAGEEETPDGEEKKPERPKYQAASGLDMSLVDMIEHEIMDSNPNIHWDDIASLRDVKELLRESAVYPMLIPGFFNSKLRRPWKGILLYGPPGTGKTMLAKAVATECGTTFFNVTSATLTSKWRGESEKLIHILFDMARFYAPTTIFIDEVDALGSSRGGASPENEASVRFTAQLLQEMDGCNTDVDPEHPKWVLVLCATNIPWSLDEALRRRLEKRIYVPLPDKEGRREVLRLALQSVPVDPSVDLDHIANITEGYSCADITNICRDAAMMPLRRKLRGKGLDQVKALGGDMNEPIQKEDFEVALTKIRSSVNKEQLERFKKWTDDFGAV